MKTRGQVITARQRQVQLIQETINTNCSDSQWCVDTIEWLIWQLEEVQAEKWKLANAYRNLKYDHQRRKEQFDELWETSRRQTEKLEQVSEQMDAYIKRWHTMTKGNEESVVRCREEAAYEALKNGRITIEEGEAEI